MFTKRLSVFLILLLGLGLLYLQADVSLDLKLRFYEGMRSETMETPRSVTSSYLQSTVTASIKSKYLPAEEQDQIKKVFNLKDVRLITEADLKWNSEDSERIFHIFRLDSKEYLFLITPISPVRKRQFRIEVFEQSQETKNSLLDTEIILPEDNIAVFGFEDTQANPYFISFHIPGAVLGGVVGGVLGGVSKKEIPGAVRAIGDVKPPKLLEKVDPVYPEEARQARVEGVVILEATTDTEGHVARVSVLRSNSPLLNQAAIDAVQQWKYKPMLIEGKPRGVIFTVTCRFKLKDKNTEDFDRGAFIAKDDKEIKVPKPLKKVNPIYPEEAKKAMIQGVVVLRVWVDEQGLVDKVMVIKSESAVLNKPAIDAVRQWKYEVSNLMGKPTPVVFNVTVPFKLK